LPDFAVPAVILQKITAGISLSTAEILGFGQNTWLLSPAVPGCFLAAVGVARMTSPR
jgi:hypothetical protein